MFDPGFCEPCLTNTAHQASLLRSVTNQTHQLGNLCDSQQASVVLSPVEADTIWSIVDYSTMSNGSAAELTQAGMFVEDNVWPDSWIALFGLEQDQDAMRFQL